MMRRESSARRGTDRRPEQSPAAVAPLPRVIAVTGTSGKTTTAWLTAAVLAEGGHATGVLSDLGCLGPEDDAPIVADYAAPIWFTTWLARLAAAGCSHAVVEVSDRMLVEGVLADVPLDTVVITNLDRTGRHPRSRRHRDQAVKAGLVSMLTAGGCLVSGCDPAGQATLRSRLPAGADVITAGLAAACDVKATAVEGSLFGRTVLASCRGQIVPLSLDTPVVPFVRDSLLAAAVGSRYGVSLEAAVRGIESAGPVPGRVERIDRGHEAAIFLDAPTSRHALAATLGSLRRLTAGRLVVLAEEPLVARLGGGHFGPLVARHCDGCVIAPTSVLAEDPAAADVAAYARIDRLLGSLGAGDCGLVLGGGGRTTPPGRRCPLAMLVDAWLQLAEPAPTGQRHAA
jgi:UDP-N-acetylmuramoyl-L-alanyl-D-glutamate--2,6-diaminopimelate ligase